MPAERRTAWATKTIAVTDDVKTRLAARRAYPKEPFWSIIDRLLSAQGAPEDEHLGTGVRAEGAPA